MHSAGPRKVNLRIRLLTRSHGRCLGRSVPLSPSQEPGFSAKKDLPKIALWRAFCCFHAESSVQTPTRRTAIIKYKRYANDFKSIAVVYLEQLCRYMSDNMIAKIRR